jgi:hypothetical protein
MKVDLFVAGGTPLDHDLLQRRIPGCALCLLHRRGPTGDIPTHPTSSITSMTPRPQWCAASTNARHLAKAIAASRLHSMREVCPGLARPVQACSLSAHDTSASDADDTVYCGSKCRKGAAARAAGNRMVGPPSSWSLRDQEDARWPGSYRRCRSLGPTLAAVPSFTS